MELKDQYIDESQYSRVKKPERLRSNKSSLMNHISEADEKSQPQQDKKTIIEQQKPQPQLMQMVQARYGTIDEKDDINGKRKNQEKGP